MHIELYVTHDIFADALSLYILIKLLMSKAFCFSQSDFCIFDQQVPLSLAIRVASLRGTLRLQIKPPPSDQLWFAFTSMPDIDFNLESSVREHKITSGHIAFFLANRIKV